MFEYEFMRTAFAATAIVALVAGVVGYFLVLRAQNFAGHALSHIGFAGATGAGLIGLAPLWGLLGFTLFAAVIMGLMTERRGGVEDRDLAIGVILSGALGLGLLFLHFYTTQAVQATSLLFGNVFGIERDSLWALLGLSLVCWAGLLAIARPLLFVTLQPELAEARGISPRKLSVAFLVITAIAVAESVQIVGVLLVFILMIGPAAAATRVTQRLGAGLLLSGLLALGQSWAGLVMAYVTDWPPSFWVSAFSGLGFAVCSGIAAWRSRLA